VSNRFNAWSTEASRTALHFACVLFGQEEEDIVERVLHHMAAAIMEEVVVFLGQRKEHNLPESIGDSWGRWFQRHAMLSRNPYLDVEVSSKFPIIGIGAPAGIFLEKVAEYFKIPLFLPPHAHVANAVGAVAGSVMIFREALVYPYGDERVQGFHVQAGDRRLTFRDLDTALVRAREAASEEARVDALTAGAIDPKVFIDVSREGAYFRVVAKALGNPKLSW
jgi:hypothetical protein